MDKENEFEGSNLPVNQHYTLILKRFENLKDELFQIKKEEFSLKTEISKFSEISMVKKNRESNLENLKSTNDIEFEVYLKKIANLEHVIFGSIYITGLVWVLIIWWVLSNLLEN